LTKDGCVLNLAGSFSSPAIKEILTQLAASGQAATQGDARLRQRYVEKQRLPPRLGKIDM
jgi:hypothetical protein